MNVIMGAFVGSGLGLDDEGRLSLPDGLNADRVHRFIDLVMGERHASPREAMHALFRTVGIDPAAVGLLDEILHDSGDVDLAAVPRRAAALTAALPELQRIPTRFQAFLVDDLGLADPASDTLEKAVASARHHAADRLGCAADWDAILARPDGVTELARPWRERSL